MKNQTSQTIAILALFTAAMASRIYNAFPGAHVQWLQNFSPLAALCLCVAVYFPRKLAVILPVSVIFISDLIINQHDHVSLFCVEMLSRYIALGLVIALGWMIQKQQKTALLLPAALLGSISFYIITNTGSWISETAYQKTFAGWVQALTSGVPGYPSTWTFFRSTFVSDMLFATLFVLCMIATSNRTPAMKLDELHTSSAS